MDSKHKDRAGKVLLEGRVEDHFYHKTGEWRKLERIIDHTNKIYKKTIRDTKTGKILYFREEPLSQHVGHGSDRTFRHVLRRKYRQIIQVLFGGYKTQK